jgi:hypothetical protein
LSASRPSRFISGIPLNMWMGGLKAGLDAVENGKIYHGRESNPDFLALETSKLLVRNFAKKN